MTKTIHPVLSHYSSTKCRGGEGGAYDKFPPKGGVLIRSWRLFEGGGGGELIRRYTVNVRKCDEVSKASQDRKDIFL